MFRAPAMLLPHESTVAHEQRFIMDEPMISRSRLRQEPTVEENLSSSQQANDEIQKIALESLSDIDLPKLQVIQGSFIHCWLYLFIHYLIIDLFIWNIKIKSFFLFSWTTRDRICHIHGQ